MAASSSVQILGLRELQQSLRALPKALQGAPMRNALHSGARIIKNAARNTTAWRSDTGFLRENIVQFSVAKSETRYDAEVHVGVRRYRGRKKRTKRLVKTLQRRNRRGTKNIVTAYYWKYLEYGTSRMFARPFMRPAFEANKVAASERIADVLREKIARAAKR